MHTNDTPQPMLPIGTPVMVLLRGKQKGVVVDHIEGPGDVRWYQVQLADSQVQIDLPPCLIAGMIQARIIEEIIPYDQAVEQFRIPDK